VGQDAASEARTLGNYWTNSSRTNCSKGEQHQRKYGLNHLENDPKGSIRKTDVGVAKNYLNEKELSGLNRIVTMYLDFAENQALKGVVMYMKDWILKLDAFLQFNEEAVLKHQGKVSHEVALALAESEFEKYRIAQDKLLESDFDKVVKKLIFSGKRKK
jgi:hypothetical protein